MTETKQTTGRGGSRSGAGRPRRRFCVYLTPDEVTKLEALAAAQNVQSRAIDPTLPNDLTADEYLAATVSTLLSLGRFEV